MLQDDFNRQISQVSYQDQGIVHNCPICCTYQGQGRLASYGQPSAGGIPSFVKYFFRIGSKKSAIHCLKAGDWRLGRVGDWMVRLVLFSGKT